MLLANFLLIQAAREFTIGAYVIATVYLTVSPFLFPAGLCKTGRFGLVYTAGTTVHVPAGVKLQVMLYCWQVKLLCYQALNEMQTFYVILRVEALAASPERFHNTALQAVDERVDRQEQGFRHALRKRDVEHDFEEQEGDDWNDHGSCDRDQPGVVTHHLEIEDQEQR